jgi:hypothetical protein
LWLDGSSARQFSVAAIPLPSELSLGMRDLGDHGMGSLAEPWFRWHSARWAYT